MSLYIVHQDSMSAYEDNPEYTIYEVTYDLVAEFEEEFACDSQIWFDNRRQAVNRVNWLIKTATDEDPESDFCRTYLYRGQELSVPFQTDSDVVKYVPRF